MKYARLLLIVLVAVALATSCAKKSGELTPEEFLKIEGEIFETDLTPESKEAIVKKYNYTLEQYDPELKAKVGEARLKKIQGDPK